MTKNAASKRMVFWSMLSLYKNLHEDVVNLCSE